MTVVTKKTCLINHTGNDFHHPLDKKQTGLYILAMERTRATSDARQRILETADRLFYQEGIRAVGIDRIIAAAGVAKMSLYKHFPSKNALILAVLQHREQEVLAFFEERMKQHRKKNNDPLKVFFAALRDWFETPAFRGCAFINASVELAQPTHPGFVFARGHKERFGDFLKGVVEQAVGKAGATIAPAVSLLVEGAIVSAVMQGKPDAADVARDAALQLVSGAKSL